MFLVIQIFTEEFSYSNQKMVTILFAVMHVNQRMQHHTKCQNMDRLAYCGRLSQIPNQNNLNQIYQFVAKNSSEDLNIGAKLKKKEKKTHNLIGK